MTKLLGMTEAHFFLQLNLSFDVDLIMEINKMMARCPYYFIHAV